LYRLVERYSEQVKGLWEERFERVYGFWRGFVDDIVYRYSGCGLFEAGFVRVYCDACKSEFLVAFSCQARNFCPSCSAKRAAIFGALLVDEILEDVPHSMWSFTVPKMLRPYFLHHRELLDKLCRAAWETVHELMAEAACEEDGFRPGMVAVVHTAGSFLAWHPHAHVIVSRGGWTRDGDWIPVSYVDMRAAELLFRHKIFLMLKKEGLLSDERVNLMLSWRHTGFSVDSSVRVDAGDTKALERVARYILRPPVSLERLSWHEATGEVSYTAKSASSGHTQSERFDPLDFLARVIMHVPEPKLHTARFYGEYSSVARGKRRAEKAEQLSPEPDGGTEEPSSEERRRMRRSWAQSIKRIYELDPLTCPDCGAAMRIISFILEPKVVDKILNHLSQNGIEPGRGPPDPAVEPAIPPS
jgi:hypothetical protein